MRRAVWQDFGVTPDDVGLLEWSHMTIALRLEAHYGKKSE